MEAKKVQSNSKATAYTGDIKMVLKKGKSPYKTIKQHNAGTLEFFKYILNVTRGDILPDDRPAHVKLVYTIDDVEVISKYGVMYESVSSAYSAGTTEAPKAGILYKFLIPETIVEQGSITGLQLESVSGVRYAKVDLTAPVEILSNTNIELEWNLYLCNN